MSDAWWLREDFAEAHAYLVARGFEPRAGLGWWILEGGTGETRVSRNTNGSWEFRFTGNPGRDPQSIRATGASHYSFARLLALADGR